MVLHNPTKRVIDILNIISKNSDKLTFSNISKSLETVLLSNDEDDE